MRSKLLVGTFLFSVAAAIGVAAAAVELKETVIDKFGYSLKIPEPFHVDGAIGNTTTWIYQPGAAPAAKAADGESAPKKKGLGGLGLGSKLKSLGSSKAEESTPSTGGGSTTQPALTIYVNWTYMKDVSSKQMYDINKKDMLDKIKGPNPEYTDLKELKIKDGYAFTYKEVDKTNGSDIHRWHILAYGNKSAYTVGLCGTYAQFAEWGKVYEDVINSFAFVPLKG